MLLQALASNLLGRAKDLANNEDLRSDVCFQLTLLLADKQIKRAQHLLATPQADGNVDATEAVDLLNTANEVLADLSSEDEGPNFELKAAAATQMQAQVRNIVLQLLQNGLHDTCTITHKILQHAAS